MQKTDHRLVLATAASLTMLAGAPAVAADNDEPESVVVTGTRVANRSALDTAAPVDVIASDALKNLGVSEVNQALSVALPSYNFPRPGLADGTDTIRPATLRGLSPDQSLVLVNSKRRHSASLVNLNGTIGRGAAAVDLNTIPSSIVQSIEVLRDGASAQYGSDAIAGVINVRLRENRDGGEVSASYGVHKSSYDTQTAQPGGTPFGLPANATWATSPTLSRSVSDGGTATFSAWKGFSLNDNGFLDIAAEYVNQAHTERDGWDPRQQYPLVGGQFDPREKTFDRFDGWYGEPEIQQKTIFANMGYNFSSDAKLYGWASWQERDARSAGFFRPAADTRNVIQIYPDGFLPIIAPEVTDWSAALGTAWKLGEWDMDSSVVWGMNRMNFTIENTLNRSLGPASKTTFNSGGFRYDQLVYNFSGVRQFAVGAFASPLNVAAGLEARREGYKIFAGEPDSYRNGGVLIPVGATGCTAPTAAQTTAGGCATASGAQVFPGFRPSNVVDQSRTAVGAYVDLETNFVQNLLTSVALRGEHYSDFGNNVSGKLSARYDFTPMIALRSTIQNGFRAPSLQQQYFATTSTNFVNGIPLDITTFPVTDPVAKALGAKPLDPEKSTNASLGAVLRVTDFSVTVDGYLIKIKDRIVLSENLTQANVVAYLTAQGFIGTGGGRFFINGVDTTTKGVDIVAHYSVPEMSAGKFDITLTGNFNQTEVTRLPQTAQLAALNPAPPLFARINVLTFEQGTPKNKFGLLTNWGFGIFGATLRATRYGEYLTPGTTGTATSPDFTSGPSTLVDVEARVTILDHLKLSIGADNVLDKYPDGFPPVLNQNGNADFTNYSPFGRAGRFIYGRVSYDF